METKTQQVEQPATTTMAPPADLIKISHASRILGGVHVSAIHRWIDQGRVRGWRVGGQRRVSRADIEAMIVPCEVKAERRLVLPPKKKPPTPQVSAATRAGLARHGIKV